MHITVIDGRMSTTHAMLAHIHARIERALHRLATRVRSVEVHLDDLNGPKGGIDKRCLIRARLRRGEPVIVRETADEFYGAIDAAAVRLKRVVCRVVDRRKGNGPRR